MGDANDGFVCVDSLKQNSMLNVCYETSLESRDVWFPKYAAYALQLVLDVSVDRTKFGSNQTWNS